MSRASDLRDEVVLELKDRISIADDRIDAFLVPDFEREELDTPRVGVRIGGRDVDVDQGPDTRIVTIEIGVLGLTSEANTDDEITKAQFRALQVESADTLDAVMEEILALWSPEGPLAYAGLAEHAFAGIEQPAAFDPKQLYDNGVWVAIAKVMFRDTEDV